MSEAIGVEHVKDHRRRSVLWQYFDKIDSYVARCCICHKTSSYKSTTSNMKRHLIRQHPNINFSVEVMQEGTDETDPRESLKEFISLEGDDGSLVEADDVVEAEEVESGDPEWNPPKKFIRKSIGTLKKIKPEVITSNGVDYLLYSHEQRSQVRASPAKVVVPPREPTPTPSVRQIARAPDPPSPVDDEFTCFGQFLSKRIRSIGDPFWQSCVINEINSAFHRVEMRRFTQSKALVGTVLPQTDPLTMPEQQEVVEEMVPHEDLV